MFELLASLSAAAAGGFRIALPLLLIGLLQGDELWARVPLLSMLPSPVVLGVLVSGSLVEVIGSKSLLGQRLLQLVQLLFSPVAGALLGMTIATITGQSLWLAGSMGGLLALVLQLAQVGWFFRMRGLPLWAVFVQDILCVLLVLLALDAPTQGGLIALLLLWLAIRSINDWRRWYRDGRRSGKPPPD